MSMATRRTGGCMGLVYREQVDPSKRSNRSLLDAQVSLDLQHLQHARSGTLSNITGMCNEWIPHFTM